MKTNEELLHLDGEMLIVGFDQQEVTRRIDEIGRLFNHEHQMLGINGKPSELRISREEITWTHDEKFIKITGMSIFRDPSFLLGRNIGAIEYTHRALALKYMFSALSTMEGADHDR